MDLFAWISTGILFFYSIICSAYNLLFAIASLGFRRTKKSAEAKTSFILFVPAYKEDAVILESTKSNINAINYPRDMFKLVVIADQLQDETIKGLAGMGENVEVHPVSFEKSTKVKSLNSALNKYQQEGFEYLVVLDADNVVDKDFLWYLDACVKKGYQAIQGKRTAKNKNNSLSILDGLSEEINNSIFRKGGNALGFSSPISGSGMAYDYALFSDILKNESALGGFDKMLQVRVLERRKKIKFCAEAIVFDEKTDDSAVFQNQRKRWLNSHFTYFAKFAGNGIKGLFTFNLDLFNLAIFIHGLLPRSFNAVIIGLMLGIALVTPDAYFLNFNDWVVVCSAFVIANLLAIPKAYWNVDLLKAIGRLPATLLNMLLALFRIRESKTSFIHTPHKNHNANE